MADVLSVLEKWQSLAGSIISAAAAFAVAFLVAYINRRREDVSAAMILVGNLTTVMGAHATLEELAKKEDVAAADYPMWLAQRLSSSRPALSPLFDASVARMMPLDTTLAAHLELFNVVYCSVEGHMDRIVEDIEYCREHNKLLRDKKDTMADADVVRASFATAARYAECAERLLSHVVLSRWRVLHRARRLFWSTDAERECSRLLKTGAL
jgi:hypothetical protein